MGGGDHVLTGSTASSDPVQQRFFGDSERDRPIVEAVQRVAQARGIPMAQVALAWVLRHPVVAAPIVGATKTQHLADAIAALDVTLEEHEIAALEAGYSPRMPTGF